MRVKLSWARLRAVRFKRPLIRIFLMAEDIHIAVICLNTEIQCLRPIPLIVNRFDETYHISKPEFDWPFFGLMAGVTFHPKLHTTY